ncbi:hypothetical protein [Streptomyces syringium]|uniref:hypothetical protein n=1 Tax=Streptomyces syringium TaxID=76729 RepID=UPI0037D51BF6
MTACPTHHNTRPPRPHQPHDSTPRPVLCKGCNAEAGSENERQAHHCPCCGERFTGRCRIPRTGGVAQCPHCGRLDAATGAWLPARDPIGDLLAGRNTLTAWYRAWEEAAIRFGKPVAHHLTQVTDADSTHLYGVISTGGQTLDIRYGARGFEVASPCPRRSQCLRGRVWTKALTCAELLAVHQDGPGAGHSECDRSHRHDN